MLAINYPRAYDNTGAHAAFRVDQSRRPARDLAISVVNGKLALGGWLERHRCQPSSNACSRCHYSGLLLS